LPLFEIALVLVPLDHVVGRIVNANHSFPFVDENLPAFLELKRRFEAAELP
jgi:hypothetical protein